jgi:proton-translocating NADH-quinone oxidoreductase chain M
MKTSISNIYITPITCMNFIISFFSIMFVCFLFLNFDVSIGFTPFYIGHYFFYIDGISIVFLFLNAFIFPLLNIYNISIGFARNLYSYFLLSIHLLLIGAFITSNLFVFYLFFEALIIPMFLIICLWGSRGRRIHSVYYFFYFTFFSSIFLLIGIIYTYSCIGSLCFSDFSSKYLNTEESFIIVILFFFGFMAKIPTLPLHIWLPEAHVEAHTVGSVILAAIILKLGFYGMFRTIPYLCKLDVSIYLYPIFITFLTTSFLYSSLVAVRQVDLKKIIAYSSIVHMNFAMLGLFGNASVGFYGTILAMLSHGFISAGLFFCVGMLYDRYHVRNILYFGGLIQYMPIFSICFMFIVFSNMGFPGTCSFVAEFLIYLSIYINDGFIFFLITVPSIFLSSVFCLVLIVRVLCYQVTTLLNQKLYDLLFHEFLICFIIILFIVILGFFPNCVLNFLLWNM